MRYEKGLSINLGSYQSLKITVADATSYEDCDKALIAEIQRLNIPVNNKIKQVLKWQSSPADW